jgi:hypothetical protein
MTGQLLPHLHLAFVAPEEQFRQDLSQTWQFTLAFGFDNVMPQPQVQ